MCELVRCTARRAAPWRVMRTRVFAALRIREAFLSMSVPLLRVVERHAVSAPTTARLSFYARAHLLFLGFFERDLLARVAHALALVRLGRLVGADLGGGLPHLLLVHALDHDLGLRGRLRLHAFGELVDDRVREAEREVHLAALRLR